MPRNSCLAVPPQCEGGIGREPPPVIVHVAHVEEAVGVAIGASPLEPPGPAACMELSWNILGLQQTWSRHGADMEQTWSSVLQRAILHKAMVLYTMQNHPGIHSSLRHIHQGSLSHIHSSLSHIHQGSLRGICQGSLHRIYSSACLYSSAPCRCSLVLVGAAPSGQQVPQVELRLRKAFLCRMPAHHTSRGGRDDGGYVPVCRRMA